MGPLHAGVPQDQEAAPADHHARASVRLAEAALRARFRARRPGNISRGRTHRAH